jgi:imidazolonepropionase-like amidohydrolase
MRTTARESSQALIAFSRARHLGGAILLAALAACGGSDAEVASNAIVYEGARVIPGDGSAPIENAVFVVENGRFTLVGPAASVTVPTGGTRVDLTGKTVIPALVNTHIHLSLDRSEREDQLRHMAYYGQGTVVSMGLDEGTVPFEMRDQPIVGGARSLVAGRGITAPEPGRSEVPYWVTTAEEARSAVAELAEADVDLVKIWVDDRGGQYERLSEPLYTAVIDEAHQHGLQVAAHIFRLEDAKGLLRAGVDMFAHGIRDQVLDDELLQLWEERGDVALIPNLPSPGMPSDLSWITTATAEEAQPNQPSETQLQAQQAAFAIQAENLTRLNEAGAHIAFGTDGSSPWAAHLELEDMVRAGMTPDEVITAATGNSAALFGLEDVGVIADGNVADFVVLDADPLDDITNTRRIADVYLRGVALDRETLAARLRGDAM